MEHLETRKGESVNEEATVTQILDDNAKHGYSERTKKDWSMARVGLSNSESVFIFNPIAVGDKVEARKSGDYTNWVKVKADPARDAIMTRLDAIEAKIDRLLGLDESSTTSAPNTAPGASKSLVERYREAKAAVKQDTVVEDINEDEPIDLSQIPF